MFLLNKPDETFVHHFLEHQRNAPFSYPEVGASRGGAPRGYRVDHNRILLGAGPEAFSRAVAAVDRWQMFALDWVELCWPHAPICTGAVVGVLVHHFGFWSLSACRVVYTLALGAEQAVERYGFAYGTLPEHPERGEERFTVEHHRATGEVWYDLYAFSKPAHPLVKAGYPITRSVQRRFASRSKKAMVRAVTHRDA